MTSDPLPTTAGARAFLGTPRKQQLIDGAWVAASSGKSFATHDPANGRYLADLPEGTVADVDAAVEAARRAFESSAWRAMTPALRGRMLWRIAEAIDAHADELAELETLDQGKPLKTARFAEIPAAAEQFRFYAGFATKILDCLPAGGQADLRVHHARTGGCGCGNHPLEFATRDGGHEIGTGAGGWLHGRTQAGRRNLAHRAQVG